MTNLSSQKCQNCRVAWLTVRRIRKPCLTLNPQCRNGLRRQTGSDVQSPNRKGDYGTHNNTMQPTSLSVIRAL
jgi:hypothetical protein